MLKIITLTDKIINNHMVRKKSKIKQVVLVKGTEFSTFQTRAVA